MLNGFVVKELKAERERGLSFMRCHARQNHLKSEPEMPTL